MPVRTYSSSHASGEWWGSSIIPRDAEGNILVIEEIHHEYAACLSKKIREEWPYYTELVKQIKCLHLYACADASIDECHREQTEGGGVCCPCWGWKQLWDLQVFERYKIRYSWAQSEGAWVGAVKSFADQVIFGLMDEEDGDEAATPVSDLPTNGLDFDDFHSNALTFRDALSAHEVPRLSQTFPNIVLDLSESDTDSENTIVDDANLVFETSSHEAGGTEVGGAAGNGIGNGIFGTNGFASHGGSGTGSGVTTTNGFASHGIDVDRSDGSEKEMEEESTQPLT